jgi:hypothetical protein
METTRSFSSAALTKNCKNPEKILALMDWACTDEGQIMLRSGLEGDHWIRDASGKRVWTDLYVQALKDPDLTRTEFIDASDYTGLPVFNLLAADGQPHGLTTQIEWIDGQGLTERQKEAYTRLGWDSSLAWYSKNIKLGYTGLAGTVYIDPASDLGAIHTMMTESRVKNSAPLILAKSDAEFEQIYRNAMAEYDRINHQSVIDEFNRQYREQASELKKYQ